MDRGPMKLTSEVSLPKDDKTPMRGEQITAGQLTGLKMHRNANYATIERKRLKSMVSTPRQVDRNPRSVHGGGEAPGGQSSLRQGAGTGSPGSPDLETAAAEQRGDHEKGFCPRGFRHEG